MPETRVDGHDQHLVNLWQDLFQHRGRGCRIDRPLRHACPSALMRCTVRCRLALPSQWTRNESEPASTNSSRKESGFEIIRCVSSGRRGDPPQRRRRSALPSRGWGRSVRPSRRRGSGRPRMLRLRDLRRRDGRSRREDRRGDLHAALAHAADPPSPRKCRRTPGNAARFGHGRLRA